MSNTMREARHRVKRETRKSFAGKISKAAEKAQRLTEAETAAR